MDAKLRQKILKLLDEHRLMTLATLRPDGWPQATTVGYVSEGLVLFFMCGKESQKARNIGRDNRVSLTVDHDTSNPNAISGLSMAARVHPVQDEKVIRRMIMEKMPEKYPEYKAMMKEADLKDVAVFEVRPEVISILDYSKGFGHTDEVEVADSDRAAA